MKEIKFRAWNKNNNQMVHSFNPVMHGEWNVLLFSEWISEWGQYVLMQYTGLKDKNGKEIYEGDVFRIPPDKHHDEPEDNVVEYSDGIYMLTDHGLYLNDWNEKGEIIGNIYENPELLGS